MYKSLKFLIYNLLIVVCFTVLAIVFDKWWIVLFALLFLLMPTTLLNKKVRICDICGRFSEPCDTDEEAIKRAEGCGWRHIKKSNKDVCPDCLKKINKNIDGLL